MPVYHIEPPASGGAGLVDEDLISLPFFLLVARKDKRKVRMEFDQESLAFLRHPWVPVEALDQVLHPGLDVRGVDNDLGHVIGPLPASCDIDPPGSFR